MYAYVYICLHAYKYILGDIMCRHFYAVLSSKMFYVFINLET